MSSNFPSRVKHFAREAGFDLCGIAPVREFQEIESFPAWIAAGHHGEMRYMESRDDAGEQNLHGITCTSVMRLRTITLSALLNRITD